MPTNAHPSNVSSFLPTSKTNQNKSSFNATNMSQANSQTQSLETEIGKLVDAKNIYESKFNTIADRVTPQNCDDEYSLETGRFIHFKDFNIDRCLGLSVDEQNSDCGFYGGYFEPKNLMFLYCNGKLVFWIPFGANISQDINVNVNNGRKFEHKFNQQIIQVEIGRPPSYFGKHSGKMDKSIDENLLIVAVAFLNSIEIWYLSISHNNMTFDKSQYVLDGVTAQCIKISKTGRIFFVPQYEKYLHELTLSDYQGAKDISGLIHAAFGGAKAKNKKPRKSGNFLDKISRGVVGGLRNTVTWKTSYGFASEVTIDETRNI
jgi:hypothetical protein